MRAAPFMLAVMLVLLLAPTVAASEPLPTGTRVEGDCIIVYDFPDAGYAICKGREECVGGLYSRTTTFIGTEERCLIG